MQKSGVYHLHVVFSTHIFQNISQFIQGMVQGIIQLGAWLVLNAILPETVPVTSVEQYKSRLVTWPDESSRDSAVTMNLLQTLKTFRLI